MGGKNNEIELFDCSKSILQQLEDKNCLLKGVEVFVKRDDLIDEWVSGNKWRKLKYNILAAKNGQFPRILTFGGAYSNHLVATAKACHVAGFESIGIVRGDELNPESNETLKQCAAFDMQLHFVTREDYLLRDDKSYIEQLHIDFPNTYIIPEGGSNFYGLSGCQEIWKEIPKEFTDVFVTAGTGTTAAGILSAMPENARLHVCSALKGDFLKADIERKLEYGFHNSEFTEFCMHRMTLYSEDTFGGYGKHTPELFDFMRFVQETFALPLDQVYTAKAFYRLFQMIQNGDFNSSSKILFIHTGGLQGNTKLEHSKFEI
jgi:1-aminocyclopropane-1-carboxylate deaminase/D-cysteine desulfhydrase-like pyridoxal-dependent ACC family enzyme